ncbi:glutaredoxin 2 [Acrodontium crateriforme]|uniref:Glutaredoxin-like protein n=1 Tax=Acrodontium crateriforme TaxID=150365 RepID=A0AAQ3R8I4_9PEZI|nr:glutaredoxin 2 [Acrodontium crateriforme]
MAMKATCILRSIRLTLFTRENCSLCDTAKVVVNKVKQTQPFEYQEINVMAASQEKWKDLYEFDTPVLHIDTHRKDGETTAAARKLMHRFSEKEVERAMDDEVRSSQ